MFPLPHRSAFEVNSHAVPCCLLLCWAVIALSLYIEHKLPKGSDLAAHYLCPHHCPVPGFQVVHSCFTRSESLEEWGQENRVSHGPWTPPPPPSLLPESFHLPLGVGSAFAEQNALSAGSPDLPLV